MDNENLEMRFVRYIPELGIDQLVFAPKSRLNQPSYPEIVAFLAYKKNNIFLISSIRFLYPYPLSMSQGLQVFNNMYPSIRERIDTFFKSNEQP